GRRLLFCHSHRRRPGQLVSHIERGALLGPPGGRLASAQVQLLEPISQPGPWRDPLLRGAAAAGTPGGRGVRSRGTAGSRPGGGGGSAATSATTSGGAPDYVREVRADFTPENRAYSRTRVALAFLSPFYDILVGLALLATGLSARMRDLAGARFRSLYGRTL